MSVTTLEGIVKDGKIVLHKTIKLPEAARVYVVVPSEENQKNIMSPRLVNKSDAKFFLKTVEEDIEDDV